MMRWMSARRSSGLVSEYDSKARRAAATALSTSAAEPRDPGNRVLGGGVDDREVVRPRGRHPLPVDVELAAVLHVSPPVMSRRTPEEISYPSRRAASRGAASAAPRAGWRAALTARPALCYRGG